jgi:NitT/TauT family transport system substrate-binding protein
MKTFLRSLTLLALVALLGGLLAACGGDDDTDDAESTATTDTAATTSTPSASASPTETGAGDLTTVVVGNIPVLIYGPVMIAKEKGYFEEYGLDVQLEPLAGGSDMVTLTANGDFDIGVGGTGPAFFNATDAGFDLKIIAPLHFEREPQATPLMVSKERFDSGELTTVQDLEGLKVAVNAPGATEYWLDTALGTGGLTIEDVDLQYLPFPDVQAALESGALDASMLGEPLATMAEQAGVAVRLDVEFPADFQPTFVWVNPDFAAESPELVTGFAAGMMRGCRDLRAEDWASDENLSILNSYTNVPIDLIRESARTYCEPNGAVNVDDVATLQEFFMERGLIEYDEPLDVATLIDTQFVEAALEEIGTSDID